MADTHDVDSRREEPATGDPRDRYAAGQRILDVLNPDAASRIYEALDDISPGFGEQMYAYAYGDIFSRPGLSPQQRQLVTIAVITALGGCDSMLEAHVEGGLNFGLTVTEIVESMIHASVYCGFPKGLTAIFIAKRVFVKRGLLPDTTAPGP